MNGVKISELWNGASGFSQVAIIAAIILAIYVITKKSFFLYASAIMLVLGIISVDTTQGNPANESVGAIISFCSMIAFFRQVVYGLSGKIWSIIAFIVGFIIMGIIKLG